MKKVFDRIRWSKYIISCMIIIIVMTFTACSSNDGAQIVDKTINEVEENISDDEPRDDIKEVSYDTEWVVYWYLCGSDLETNYGAATSDLQELLAVELPENVKVVIQTGGSLVWHNDIIKSDVLGRYLYDQNGLQLIEEIPSASMGDSQTFTEFLLFGKEKYPAKRTAVVFWNHGGGSVTGVAFDEQYDMDYLSLNEMYQAFTEAYGEDSNNQPIDIIGFDACLMATVDTAYTLSDIGKYLVASQELEPGNGWLYNGWIGALAQKPDMEPIELAKAICDTYQQGSIEAGREDSITLSVIDLSKITELVTAYDDFGKEALATAMENPSFFAHFSQIANTVENYGGNTKEQGFTNMTDLGSLAIKSVELLPETSGAVTEALADCVVYKVNGKYRPNSMGISCYYSYNGDVDDFIGYTEVSPSYSFQYLYAYGLTGELSEEGMNYISQMNYSSLPELKTLKNVSWDEKAVTVDDNGNSTLTLGSEAINILSSLTFQLYYADPEEDILLSLGRDNNIIADWENGVFKDNFHGLWGSLDGALCYMEIAYEGDGYNQYSVPILLNGEEYNLMVIYDFGSEQFYIDGARKPLNENGAADKNLRYLAEGDEIQTIHYATSISGEDSELMAVPIDTIIVTSQISFTESELGDGYFIMMYVMQDSQGNEVYSAPVTFESVDGIIYTTVEE